MCASGIASAYTRKCYICSVFIDFLSCARFFVRRKHDLKLKHSAADASGLVRDGKRMPYMGKNVLSSWCVCVSLQR